MAKIYISMRSFFLCLHVTSSNGIEVGRNSEYEKHEFDWINQPSTSSELVLFNFTLNFSNRCVISSYLISSFGNGTMKISFFWAVSSIQTAICREKEKKPITIFLRKLNRGTNHDRTDWYLIFKKQKQHQFSESIHIRFKNELEHEHETQCLICGVCVFLISSSSHCDEIIFSLLMARITQPTLK